MLMDKRQRQKYKPVESVYKVIQGLEQVLKGSVQTQAKWQ